MVKLILAGGVYKRPKLKRDLLVPRVGVQGAASRDPMWPCRVGADSYIGLKAINWGPDVAQISCVLYFSYIFVFVCGLAGPQGETK